MPDTQRGDEALGAVAVDHGSVGHKFALNVDHNELREVLFSLGLPFLVSMLVAAWLIHSSTGLASRLDRLPWCAPPHPAPATLESGTHRLRRVG